MAGVVKDQIGGSIFAIFDENARATAVPEPRYAAAHKAGIITLNWVTDKIDEQIAKGKVIKAQTLAELADLRSEEHTSELQSPMRISSAVFCLNKNTNKKNNSEECLILCRNT